MTNISGFTSPRVLFTEKLTGEVLESYLFTKDYSALIIGNAIPPCAAAHITRKIIGSSDDLVDYGVEPSFQKLGAAWFDHSTDEARAEHLANTLKYSEATHSLCHPYPSPMDTLKLLLDVVWRPGALNQRINGMPLYYGLPRALKPGGSVCPHIDWLPFDSPGVRGAEKLRRQIAANCYLRNADTGGEIKLWDHLDLSPAELIKMRLPGHPYSLDPDLLGPPAVTIKAPEGSILLFDASKPHSVTATTGSRQRLTFSSFIGYFGAEEPLTLWS